VTAGSYENQHESRLVDRHLRFGERDLTACG